MHFGSIEHELINLKWIGIRIRNMSAKHARIPHQDSQTSLEFLSEKSIFNIFLIQGR